MQEKLKDIPKKLLEWWNKFSVKQKLVICGVAAGVLTAIIVLATVLTKPKYINLMTCETEREAAEVVELLDGEGLNYRTSNDGKKIEIKNFLGFIERVRNKW